MKRIILYIIFSLCFVTTYAQITEKQKAQIKQKYIETCSDLNKQAPITIDEYTQLTNMTFVNWTLICSYRVNIDFSIFSQEDKNEMISDQRQANLINVSKMLISGNYMSRLQLREFMRTTGMKLRQTYTDVNGVYIGSLEYDYKDF